MVCQQFLKRFPFYRIFQTSRITVNLPIIINAQSNLCRVRRFPQAANLL